MKKIVLILMLLTLLITTGCQGTEKHTSAPASDAPKPEAQAKQPTENGLAPDAKIKTFEGTQVMLSELSKDKPLYLNFWASWCPPCVREMPHIEKMYQKYGDKINFAAVTVDENIGDAEAFTAKAGFTMPIYTGDAKQLGQDYGLEAIPVSLIIKQGKIVSKVVGAMDATALEQFLSAGLK